LTNTRVPNQTCILGYLDTCPNNDVILFSQIGFCALWLGLQLGLAFEFGIGLRLAEIRFNTFWLVSDQFQT